MAERPKGMGRGLAAIMSVAPRDELQELRPIPVDMVDPSPNQPRHRFDEDSLTALVGLDPHQRRASADPRSAPGQRPL